MFDKSMEIPFGNNKGSRQEALKAFDSKYISSSSKQNENFDEEGVIYDYNIEMGEQDVDEESIKALEDQIKDPRYKKIFSKLSNDDKTIFTATHGLSVETLKKMLLLQERVGRKKYIPAIHGLRNRLSLLYYTGDPKYKELENYIKEISR